MTRLGVALATCLLAGCAEPVTRLHCGEEFSIRLAAGEKVTVHDPDLDFIIHRFADAIVYEGNAPQPGGFVHKTGKTWPSHVVVQGAGGAALNKRIMLPRDTACAR